MVLAAVEGSLYTSKVEALKIPKGLSIEHVMPQTWEEHWPLRRKRLDQTGEVELSEEELDEAKTLRNAHVHLLGNLTIVTQPLNAALSNAPWSRKQKELNKHSKLLLNSRLVEEYPSLFDEASIEARGEFLAERVLAIWPGPNEW